VLLLIKVLKAVYLKFAETEIGIFDAIPSGITRECPSSVYLKQVGFHKSSTGSCY